MTLYDFTVNDNQGNAVSLADYKGDVVLVLNTATGCGLTPQYEDLEALYKKYQDQGFVILDFPSNQFLEQAPGTDAEINEFCTLTYNTTFPRFSKIDVNGETAAPLFAWLKENAPAELSDADAKKFEKIVHDLKPIVEENDIKWNFTKFLIDRNGNIVERFSPAMTPKQVEEYVKKEL